MKSKLIKRSSHPVMFFVYLSLLFIIISGIASALNFQVTYEGLTTIAGEVESKTVAVNSLLSLDGLKYLITSAYDNLNTFAPFGMLLIAAISFGIALKSSFLKVLFSRISAKVPKWVIVFVYALLCIVLSVEGNAAYVLLLPLGAVMFMAMNRNPLGGLALGFAAIASGHGAGLFVNLLDYSLASTTEASAVLLEKSVVVAENSNLIFIIVAALAIAAVCTVVCEKIVVRKLGRNQIEEDDEFVLEEANEKKGLIAVLIASIIYLIPIILMILPLKGNFFGLLLDKSQTGYANMLFSEEALFMTNFVGIVSLLFGLQGFVFGVVTGTIRKISDMVNFSTNYLKSIGGIFVLIFFAAQLYGIVNETNLGVVIAGVFSNIIGNSSFGYVPLIGLLLLFTMIVNIFIPNPITKWEILAPTVVPALYKTNITPEFSQLIFRAGDSITNVITPMFVYFVIFIGFVEVYTKNKKDFSIKKCYKIIIPYFLAIALVWILLLLCWFVIGLPIGPGVYPTV